MDLFSCQHQRQATQAIPTPRHQRAKTRSYSALCRCVCAAGLAMPFKASGRRSRQFQASSTPTGQVGSSRLAAGQHQVLEEVLPLRLPGLKPSHLPFANKRAKTRSYSALCRCVCAAGLAMPFKASGRRSRQFQASSTPTGQVGSSRLAAGQHQLLEQVLPVRLPALKAFHCRCQY